MEKGIRRVRSMDLMAALQPFTQGGILRGQEARHIVERFIDGDPGPLERLVSDPGMPMAFHMASKALQEFI